MATHNQLKNHFSSRSFITPTTKPTFSSSETQQHYNVSPNIKSGKNHRKSNSRWRKKGSSFNKYTDNLLIDPISCDKETEETEKEISNMSTQFNNDCSFEDNSILNDQNGLLSVNPGDSDSVSYSITNGQSNINLNSHNKYKKKNMQIEIQVLPSSRTQKSQKSNKKKPTRLRTVCRSSHVWLLANSRFLLSHIPSHIISLSSPSFSFDWDNVISVLFRVEIPPHCPICLSHPRAMRIGKCSHVFCLYCILHYFSVPLSEYKKVFSCPVCQKSLADLKPAKFEIQNILKIGDSITFNLMKYDPNLSPYPIPVDGTINNFMYERFLLCSNSILKENLYRDLDDLIYVTNDNMYNDEEIPFVEMAFQSIIQDYERDKKIVFQQKQKVSDNSNSLPDQTPQKTRYFYQSSDGQQIFLHPVPYRFLLNDYESVEKLPLTITGTILETTQLMQDDDIRKLHRVFTHLPNSSVFSIAFTDICSSFSINSKEKELFKHECESLIKKREHGIRLAERKEKENELREKERREKKIRNIHNDYYYSEKKTNPLGIIDVDNGKIIQNDWSRIAEHGLSYSQKWVSLGNDNNPQKQIQHQSNNNNTGWAQVVSRGFAYIENWDALPKSKLKLTNQNKNQNQDGPLNNNGQMKWSKIIENGKPPTPSETLRKKIQEYLNKIKD